MTQSKKPPLTNLEKYDLKLAIKGINAELETVGKSWRKVAQLARDIRGRELWRDDAKSWGEFCDKQGWTRGRFNQLIRADAVLLAIPQTVDTAVSTERAARELAKVPEEQRVEVINEAKKNGTTITAPAIQAAAAAVLAPKKPSPVLDETGCEIPIEIVPLWDRRQELVRMMTEVSRLKCSVEKSMKEDDPLYRYLTNTIIPHFQALHYALSECRPYSVCLYCQGHPDTKEGGCADCKNTGFMTKRVYETGANKELAQFRERSIKLKGKHDTQRLSGAQR